MSTTAAPAQRPWLQRLNDYYELCKPRVVMLIVFTAVVGMFLATPGMVPLDILFFGTLGIGLMAASAAVRCRPGTCPCANPPPAPRCSAPPAWRSCTPGSTRSPPG
jgi:hypothetical protein